MILCILKSIICFIKYTLMTIRNTFSHNIKYNINVKIEI